MKKLAILGGEKTVTDYPADLFTWPIVTREVEQAVLEVLRVGGMSGSDVTKKFEGEFAGWHKRKYGLGANNGTASLHCAMFGLGIGRGDEIICPSITYWASCMPVLSLGGTVVFADIDPETLCIDPKDIEHRITPRTKAIVVVHYCGRPCEMDKIMAIARKHRVAVIEDCSHSHGALYKRKMVGTFSEVSAFSLMSGKSFAIGEAGIMLTDDRTIYERGCAFGYYERSSELNLPELKNAAGLPWGGYKYRMHQLSSAMGLVQLKKYPGEMAEIDQAMNHFWDNLEGVPGIRPNRPAKGSGTTMGGWYNPLGHYVSEELKGLSITRFCQAVTAEGAGSAPGCNKALHLHPLFNTVDIYRDGKPTRIVNSQKDLRQPPGSLPVSEGIQTRVFSVPYFKKFYPEAIERFAGAFRKVAENCEALLKDDPGNPPDAGNWGLTFRL